MHRAFLALLLLTGCTTTEEAMRNDQLAWIGRPVRTFVEVNSLVPTDAYDTPTGSRTFIFRKPGMLGNTCGITIVGKRKEGYSEFVIANMASTCPPGSF
jgi:hypothetical protein